MRTRAPASLEAAPAAIGQQLLDGTAEHRQIALILLRDAHNIPSDALTAFHRSNSEIVYADVADRLLRHRIPGP